MIERGKQYKFVTNIPSIEDRLQTTRAFFKPFIFKTAQDVPENDFVSVKTLEN